MTRLSGGNHTESQSNAVYPVWCLFMDVVDNPIRINSSDMDFVIGTDTYKHSTFSMPTVQETRDASQRDMKITLALDPADASIAAMLENPANYRQRDCICKLYFVSPDIFEISQSSQLTGAPLLTIVGSISSIGTQQAANAGAITIFIQDLLSQLDRPVGPMMTKADQQHRYAGDTIFDYVPKIPGKLIVWMGRSSNNSNGYNFQDKLQRIHKSYRIR